MSLNCKRKLKLKNYAKLLFKDIVHNLYMLVNKKNCNL